MHSEGQCCGAVRFRAFVQFNLIFVVSSLLTHFVINHIDALLTTKACAGVEIRLHFSLSSVVDGGERLVSRYGRFISGEGISVTHLWTSEPICTS
jgi:hypothetical protein